MAEFCLSCWNRLNGFHKTERDYVLSDEYDLCEGCRQYRRVIKCKRRFKPLYDWKTEKSPAEMKLPRSMLSPQSGRFHCEKENHRLCPWHEKGYFYAEKKQSEVCVKKETCRI